MPILADSMYKCELCGKISKPRTPSHKVVLETRTMFFSLRPKAFACWKQEGNRKKFVRPDDPGGMGKQIVKEATVCQDCTKRFSANEEKTEPEANSSYNNLSLLMMTIGKDRAPPSLSL